MLTTHLFRGIRRPITLAIGLTLGGLFLSACGDAPVASTDSAPASAEVTRVLFGQTDPSNAPGQTLYLQQIAIPGGVALPTHFHEGTQIATIQAGVLTYHVVKNTVTVNHADGTSEEVSAPSVVELKVGDGVVETSDMVHWAENKGTQPVQILLATLLTKGAPLSTKVG